MQTKPWPIAGNRVLQLQCNVNARNPIRKLTQVPAIRTAAQSQ